MPLALIALAWLLVMTGINGNYTNVGNAFEQDVMGQGGSGGGFLNFLVGIVGIAVFFRMLGMPNAGRVFLILIIIVFILQNQGVLTALESLGASTTATNGQGQASASTGSNVSSATTTPASALGAVTVGSNPGNATPLTTLPGSGGIGSA